MFWLMMCSMVWRQKLQDIFRTIMAIALGPFANTQNQQENDGHTMENVSPALIHASVSEHRSIPIY